MLKTESTFILIFVTNHSYLIVNYLKVLMESKEAIGVQFFILNKTVKAIARKGVILSAGAIGTPKILMLSGIGPRRHLEDLKVNFLELQIIISRYMFHYIHYTIEIECLDKCNQ